MKWIKPEKIIFGNKIDYEFEASGYDFQCVTGGEGFAGYICNGGGAAVGVNTCNTGNRPIIEW